MTHKSSISAYYSKPNSLVFSPMQNTKFSLGKLGILRTRKRLLDTFESNAKFDDFRPRGPKKHQNNVYPVHWIFIDFRMSKKQVNPMENLVFCKRGNTF